jgi:hypothetical protein
MSIMTLERREEKYKQFIDVLSGHETLDSNRREWTPFGMLKKCRMLLRFFQQLRMTDIPFWHR